MTITTKQFTAINVGTTANDGTGDDLRTAFIKVNDNFQYMGNTGFNAGNIYAPNGTVQAAYFIGDGSQLSNVSGGGGGASNYSNVNVAAYLNTQGYNLYSNVNVASYLPSYTGVLTSSNVYVAGNVTARYILGSGQFLTGLPASYSNVNVTAYTETMGFQNFSNVNVAAYLNNSGYNLYSNVNVAAYLNNNSTVPIGTTSTIYANATTQATSTGTGALVVKGGVGIAGNLVVGNLTVLGTQTTVSATSVAVANSFIFLSNNNITNAVDIGFVGQYAAGQGNVYTGLTYRAADGIYRLFSNLSPAPSLTVNLASAIYSNIQVGNIIAGNVIGVNFLGSGAYLTTLPGYAYSNVNVSALITTNGLTNYSNVNAKAYTESMGFQNYGNVNVAALITTNGLTNYSNVNLIAYLGGAVNIGGSLTTLNAGNISAGGYFLGNGSQLIGLPAGYSNVQVATYLPTYSGNIANVRLGVSGVLTFADGTTQLTAAGGGSNYSNANVTAYTVTMGFTNFSNVNVQTYTETMGFKNYSNVNVSAYLSTATINTTGNIVAANITVANAVINGNVNATNFIGSGAFLTGLPASYSNVNVAAYLNTSGYNLYSNVNVAAYLNNNGAVPIGTTSTIYANAGTQSTSTGTGALVVIGGVGISGNLTVGNLTVLGTQTTVSAQSVNLSNSFVFLSNNNITNAVDIGFVGQYNAGQGNVYTGLAYRAADGIYRLFSNVSPQPSLTVNLASAVYSAIQVGNIIAANVTVNTIIGSNVYVNGNITAGTHYGNMQGFTANITSNLAIGNSIITYAGSGANINIDPDGNGDVVLTNNTSLWLLDLSPSTNTTTGSLINYGGAGIAGNLNLGTVGAVSGQFHAIVGNITQTSSGGAVYFNTTGNVVAGNIISSSATVNGIANVNMLNASGNLSVAGNSALYGNTTHGTVGVVSGAFHTFVGNITQVTSGGTQYFNTTGNISASFGNFGNGNIAGYSIGYRDLPQITAANLTLIAGDAGKHYYATNTSPTTLTIPLNSSVPFALGTAVSVVNQGTGNITIAKGSTTLYLAGNSTSANRTITSFGMATLIKVATDTWFINGTGVV